MSTPSGKNPYNWSGNQPSHVVPRRKLLAQLSKDMVDGKPTHLIGARGMGKTVFLVQLTRSLEEAGQIPILIEGRPSEYTVSSSIRHLATYLWKEARNRQAPPEKLAEIMSASTLDVSDVMEAHRAALQPDQRVVLIFDELDKWADDPKAGQSFFDALESVRRFHPDQLSLMFAGSLGLVLLRSELGSSVFSRQDRVLLEPFLREELVELARPFERAGRALGTETLDALYLASGGIPLLLTFALQQMWSLPDPSNADVTTMFQRFWLHDGHQYLRDVNDGIFDKKISPLPFRVWQVIRSRGRVTKLEIEAMRAELQAPEVIDTRDIFHMLRSSGLVSMDDPDGWNDDVVLVNPIPSILHLAFRGSRNEEKTSLSEQLVNDLAEALGEIHSMSLNYFATDGAPYPEAIFASSIALALSGRTWRCTLEPVSGAGYADLKVRHPRFGEDEAVIEVKHWPANDYKQIHDQVTSYFTKGVKAFACVMIAHHQKQDWKDEYSVACLDGKVASYAWEATEPPLRGRFVVPDDRGPVVHFLLQLARR